MDKKTIIKARAVLGLTLMCCAALVFLRMPPGFSSRRKASANTSEAVFLADGESYAVYAWPGRHSSNLMGVNDVIFMPRSAAPFRPRPSLAPVSYEYKARLSDFNYLTRSIFLTDPRTKLFPADIDVSAFLAKDQRIDTSVTGPQVLIFHAHSMEMFADSNPQDPMTGVFGVGRYLAEILSEQHGIQVMHYMGRFDVVNGIPNRHGSYERVEPAIKQILADNPSIQMVIDLHRDGIPESRAPMVTYVNGLRTAQIMFVNGLSRQLRNGVATDIHHLPNPYQQQNLAFTLNLQLAANQLYPGLARRAYLLPFRYSLHMAPQSMLLEVGAQNNTLQEALNAMHPTANIIAAVVLGE
ncbi:MAG: stage II sporulation protein P [Defluviitaleaceae bacterium]|nr:stage II sporulation protein P [Defluviitaleaceae bacterium]